MTGRAIRNVGLSSRMLLGSATSLALLTAPVFARDMTTADLVESKRPFALTASPDGAYAAYSLRSVEGSDYHVRIDLYIVDLKSPGAQPRLVEPIEGKLAMQPGFSSDSKRLTFLSNASGEGQVWEMDIATGRKRQLTNVSGGLSGYRLSHDGSRVAVWAERPVDPANAGSETVRAYEELPARIWDKWADGRQSRLMTVALTPGGPASDAREVQGSLKGSVPSRPFGGPEEISWSANGEWLYFAMRPDQADPTVANSDIFAVRSDGSAAPVNLTVGNAAVDALPAASPDGRTLAYVAARRQGAEADRQVIMIRDIETGRTRALTEAWDRSVISLTWSTDGRSLLAGAFDTLDRPIFQIDAKTGAVKRLTGKGTAGMATALPGGGLLFTASDLQNPDDLWERAGDGKLRRLTALNAERMKDVADVDIERFSFAGANGDTVWGQIVKPRGSKTPLPTALLIHGGPQVSLNDAWSTRWNPKLFAAQGMAVVTIDFHGSPGYGQAFIDSVSGKWGSLPLEDLKLGLAAAGARDPAVDTGNACALGPSFGGYMVNWIAGNWPGGFKCLVAHNGVFDLATFSYQTDELWPPVWEFEGAFHDRPDLYDKWNPIRHVGSWKTPMLVLTGERDFRVPYTQSLASFTALQMRRIPSRLVVFPDENHWVSKPSNMVRWHKEIFDWIKRWTALQ